MIRIKLPRGEWYYDPSDSLGSGGFGDVFAGTADGYGPLAIKRINLVASNAAHRELRIAEELADRQLTHVMPVLDSGLDADSGCYYIVMPRAEKSLQDDLDAGMTFVDEAAAILLQIAVGLSEVSDIVHRDLKPSNVLYHDGVWKVADFGIARFVEESTSLQTLKGCLSAPYAAPEQWQLEHATSATDIYALGCIGYALSAGQPPFSGPRRADYRLQHLQEAPPRLQVGDLELCTLLLIMLKKVPATRPDLSRVRERLSAIAEGSCKQDAVSIESGLKALAQVGAEFAEEDAKEEAKRVEAQSRFRERLGIAIEAWEALIELVERLLDQAESVVPAARRASSGGPVYCLEIGSAQLMVRQLGSGGPFAPGAFPESGWNVIVGAIIGVHQKEPSYHWSASLWYTDLGLEDGALRWYEVSYFTLLGSPEATNVPFGLQDLDEADLAACERGVHRIAAAPRPIDDEDAADFCSRWLWILADACQGKLERPRRFPMCSEEDCNYL